MLSFFIMLQVILLLFMLFHDWIPIPPFNDIKALEVCECTYYRLLGSLINGTMVLVPLILTILSFGNAHISHPIAITVWSFYFVLTLGAIFSWWVPYFFGSSEKHKEVFSKFQNTHSFLPPRGDNIRPNTLHVALHLMIWTCLGFATFYLTVRSF